MNHGIKEEDYDVLKSQDPKIRPRDLVSNTAFLAMKKYFILIFGESNTIAVNPVIKFFKIYHT